MMREHLQIDHEVWGLAKKKPQKQKTSKFVKLVVYSYGVIKSLHTVWNSTWRNGVEYLCGLPDQGSLYFQDHLQKCSVALTNCSSVLTVVFSAER